MFCIKKEYKWKLENDYSVYVKELENIQVDLPWVTISSGLITIRKGYTWNGCSPSISVLDMFFIGTPDGIVDYNTGKPKTHYASLVHDCLYQFKILGRKEADLIFRRMMKESRFALADIYYLAVRAFGPRW